MIEKVVDQTAGFKLRRKGRENLYAVDWVRLAKKQACTIYRVR